MQKLCNINAFLLSLISLTILSCFGEVIVNNRPIIGIVTEEVKPNSGQNASSFIVASYVKYLEAGGARVVPIMVHKPKKYYQDLMSKINGVLFPGGRALLKSAGYGRAGKIIFDIAVKMNDQGDYFPLWGTCLGFELMNLLAVNKNWMKACSAMDMSSNINFTKGFENSKIFKDLDDSLKTVMLNQNTTLHYHRWCFTPYLLDFCINLDDMEIIISNKDKEKLLLAGYAYLVHTTGKQAIRWRCIKQKLEKNYTASRLNEYFKVLATNKDSNGVDFISVIEAYKYPFYGVAFHPEKVLFEWTLSKTHKNTPHSAEAVKVSQYFSYFFVNEARKSSHGFQYKKEEDAALIYNYNPVFTGKKNSSFEQIYYFY